MFRLREKQLKQLEKLERVKRVSRWLDKAALIAFALVVLWSAVVLIVIALGGDP
jgi:hypothetical protein